MHTACTDEKLYKISAYAANVLCIVRECLQCKNKQGIMALCATCDFLLV